jgi:SHS2 domain-containing protein
VEDFEIIDHTADIGIVARGADLKQAFATAAVALFSLIAELEDVSEAISRDMEVTADDRESLLVEWLNELIYLFEVENIIFKRFEVTELSDTRLKARGCGERMDASRHRLKGGVKAATYYMLKVDKDDGYRVQVILDV